MHIHNTDVHVCVFAHTHVCVYMLCAHAFVQLRECVCVCAYPPKTSYLCYEAFVVYEPKPIHGFLL
jgi:hypothetical protein